MPHPEIILFFCFIAFIYSSVGFGGGSSYLAILALYAFPFKEIRIIALICNIIVVAGGTALFIRHKNVLWSKVLPIAVAGTFAAYSGASIKISERFFFIILGISLIVAGILLCAEKTGSTPLVTTKNNIARDAATGGIIGLLSGMVGIGGGIFLSPLLNLLRWDSPKRIAATACIFILVNSIAGIAGQLSFFSESLNINTLLLLGSAVLIGGQAGARLGINMFNQQLVKRVTGVLVCAAGIETLYRHLF
jgi:uncharacterized membrane protein YfcA